MSKACRVLGALTCAIVVTVALLVPWGSGVALEGTAPLVIENSQQALGVPISVATPQGVGVVAPEGEPGPAVLTVDRLPPLAAATQARMEEAYGRLPLHFEANQGQTDGQVKFVSRSQGMSLFLTTTEAVLVLRQFPTPVRTSGVEERARRLERASDPSEPPPPTQHTAPTVLRMHFVGANPAPQVVGLDELPGKVNYFIGNDATKWRTNVPTYAKVKHQDVYPGVDVVFYGTRRQLEYDFVVAPGSDPNAIRLNFQDQAGKILPLRIDSQGDLVLQIADGEVRLHQPCIYQEIGGVKQPIPGHYVLLPLVPGGGWGEGTHQVSVQVAAYDISKSLIIDPVLSYSTYLGGSGGDQANGIAVDSAGNVYVTGFTVSTDFPTTPGAFQTALRGGLCPTDAFVAKVNAAGSTLIYSTYLGGSGCDSGNSIAVDTFGNAYVTGDTAPHVGEADFPTTVGAFQPAGGGGRDAFVTKLNSDGSSLVYSTYLGGSDYDVGSGITLDGAGNAYVTGYTFSTNFPTASPFQHSLRGKSDAFVTKLNSYGSSLVYSTYLGGSKSDFGNSIAVDAASHAYVTGKTESPDFPTTPGTFDTTYNGNTDAFIAKLHPTGSSLIYSTYLGGSDGDQGASIAVDAAGNTYVTGSTQSMNFPTTPGVFQTALVGSGASDAFVTKINPTGTALIFSTYLGGNCYDFGQSIAVDAAGNAYVTGGTRSTDFPTPPGVITTACPGGGWADVFAAKLAPDGTAVVFSTVFGGRPPKTNEDIGYSIAVDAVGNVYVTGVTGSTSFPTTPGAFQTHFGGSSSDAFIAKIAEGPAVGPFLTFPLQNRTPDTAKINTVFDHSMPKQYCPDDVVVAYTGEEGRREFGASTFFQDFGCGPLHGFKNRSGTNFVVNGHYSGGGEPQFLFYDGHPGYDYRTKDPDQDPMRGRIGRRFQSGEGWHSTTHAVRFWNSSPRIPKETHVRCYASATAYVMMIPLCNSCCVRSKQPTRLHS